MNPGVATAAPTPRRARVRELITMAEYARHRGVSRAAVTNAAKRGKIHLVDGLVDPVEADRTWPPRATGAATPPSPPANGAAPPPADPRPLSAPPRGGNGARPPRATSENGRPEGVTGWDAKADLDWYKAQLAALEFAQAEGRLLDSAEVEKSIFEGYRTVRDAFQNIPDRLAAEMAAETSAPVCRRILETAIRQALNELHANLQRAD